MKKIMFLLTLSFGFFITSCSDPCKDITCSSVGTCDDGTCTCDAGYTGDNCETEQRAKFIGDWKSVDYSCNGGAVQEITFTVAPATEVTGVLFFEKSDDEEIKVPAVITNDVLTITSYSVPDEDVIVSGTISLINDVLTMSFTIIENGVSSLCTATATKL